MWMDCLVLAALLFVARAGVAAPALASTLALADAPVNVHVVEPGETVRSIAEMYGVRAETVLAANAIADPDLLRVGDRLVVPSVDGALHTVRPGETLRAIADDYGVDLSDLVAANALNTSPDALGVGTVLVVPGARPDTHVVQQPQVADGGRSGADDASGSYTVREGDTLRSIAEAFKLDILSLVGMNSLADPDLIKPGSILRVAAAPRVEHVVEPGETLGDIAWRFSVDAVTLVEANSLADPDRLAVGTTLVVPSGRPSAPSPPPAPPAPPAPAAPAPARPAPPPSPTPAPPPPPPSPSPPVAHGETPAPAPATADRVISALVTGYALGAGAVSTHTASGTVTHWGTVAADTHLYPFGTRVRIEGLGDTVFVVEDTGSAVRGNVFDVWFPDAASARRLGGRTRQVTILAP